MYRLTPRMVQRFKADLTKYHDLFVGGRCSGWELEELIVRAIQSDTRAQHQVLWTEGGHDDEADITVRTNGEPHPIQVKSGQIKKGCLILSGHRLGRFDGAIDNISAYLNNPIANFISVPCRRVDGEHGRQHIYRVCYVDKKVITGLNGTRWMEKGKQLIQVNAHGVEFSLRPSMSWQIWWTIPEALIDATDEFAIG